MGSGEALGGEESVEIARETAREGSGNGEGGEDHPIHGRVDKPIHSPLPPPPAYLRNRPSHLLLGNKPPPYRPPHSHLSKSSTVGPNLLV